jgi:hypothetical protein
MAARGECVFSAGTEVRRRADILTVDEYAGASRFNLGFQGAGPDKGLYAV